MTPFLSPFPGGIQKLINEVVTRISSALLTTSSLNAPFIVRTQVSKSPFAKEIFQPSLHIRALMVT
jgi:hypothetical protein